MELTGYGDVMYKNCKDYVDKVDKNIKSKNLDSTLKVIRSFDYL